MKKIKIGLIGCGAIGTELAKVIDKRFKENAKLAYLVDHNSEKSTDLKKLLKSKPIITSLDKAIQQSDLIIEAASPQAALEALDPVLKQKKDIVVLSVGALLQITQKQKKLIEKNQSKIYLPSGAVAGIDGLLAASSVAIDTVTLQTRKSPKALAGVDWIEKQGIDLNKIKKDTLIFEGPAKQAVRYFPKNINVAAIISLAGIGAAKTKVQIYACPKLKRNCHEIEAKGAFGRMHIKVENMPFPSNPKTSYLAALSAMALLEKIFNPIKVGS